MGKRNHRRMTPSGNFVTITTVFVNDRLCGVSKISALGHARLSDRKPHQTASCCPVLCLSPSLARPEFARFVSTSHP